MAPPPQGKNTQSKGKGKGKTPPKKPMTKTTKGGKSGAC